MEKVGECHGGWLKIVPDHVQPTSVKPKISFLADYHHETPVSSPEPQTQLAEILDVLRRIETKLETLDLRLHNLEVQVDSMAHKRPPTPFQKSIVHQT